MVSVVIPTYQEEKTISQVLTLLSQESFPHEVIVVDGGSTDHTVQFAYPLAKVVVSKRGRGIQMNEGARHAKGDIIFFLHGDCFIEEGTLEAVQEAILKGYLGGCLTHKILDSRFIFRMIESSGNIRASWARIFYGDQGIFVRADIFREIHGYKPMPLFEDIEFSKRLRGEGRTVVLNRKIYTSNRRWVRQGILRTMILNFFLILLYFLGCSSTLLAKGYRDLR